MRAGDITKFDMSKPERHIIVANKLKKTQRAQEIVSVVGRTHRGFTNINAKQNVKLFKI